MEIYFVTLRAAGNDHCNVYKTDSNITASYKEASNTHTPKHEKREYWVTWENENIYFKKQANKKRNLGQNGKPRQLLFSFKYQKQPQQGVQNTS